MSRVFVHGCGVVSPAGWGLAPFRAALKAGVSLPTSPLPRPGWKKPLAIRQVPPPQPRPAFLAHSRLRRASPITHYIVAAALEALGDDAAAVAAGKLRLGVVLCVMSGCVNYSRRFYDEVLREPATASPLLFPETVFNAPASHLAALLGTPALNYTLVGDPGAFLQGVALAAQWLHAGQIDACLVVGGEESDWLTANAFHLFSRRLVLADGAGALYLKTNAASSPPHETSAERRLQPAEALQARRGSLPAEAGVPIQGFSARNHSSGNSLSELRCITDPHLFGQHQTRTQAAQKLRAGLPTSAQSHLLVDGVQNVPRFDAAEIAAWQDWTADRISPKRLLGEGLMAAAAWQCVAAVDALKTERYTAATVSVVGCNEQAIGAHFVKS